MAAMAAMAAMASRPSTARRPRTARQRAIYSEVLLEAKGTQKLAGPGRGRELRGPLEPRPLSASVTRRARAVPSLMLEQSAKYATVEPKVIESYRTAAGRCPRKLRIERLKKKYESQDIQKLLLERDVDVCLPWYEDSSRLPLEAFDNKSYEPRTPAEWLALAKDESGEVRSLGVLALWRDPENGVGHWRRAVVLQYDARIEKYEVQYEEAEPTETGGRRGLMEFLPRLRVMFRGEDPEAFANRVAEAYKSRVVADAMLRYNFYIDNMPTDDVQQLNVDQTDWLRRAVRTRQDIDSGELEFMLQEVQLDFARAMNRVTFDTHVLQGKAEPIHSSLRPYVEQGFVAQALCRLPAPRKGLVSIPRHRFSETFAKFCFSTLRVRPEVVLALQGIKAQCHARLSENIFGIDSSRPLRLDEFRQNLRSSCAEASLSLKEDWPASLQTIVLKEFDSVQKGWFNVREKSVDLYRHGKLRRFLLLARLIMQDTLRNLAQLSVESFVSHVERLAPLQTRVAFGSCSCTWRGQAQKPLLTVEVRPTEGGTDASPNKGPSQMYFDFVLGPERFVATALDAYRAGLQFLNEVQPLERLMIPPRLQSAEGPSLIEVFQFEEDWVEDGYRRIQENMQQACVGPHEFLETLRVWEPLLRREPAALVDRFFKREEEPSDEEVQAAIAEEMRLQRELWQLPEIIDVGMFQITTKEVRKVLSAKHELTHALLMERLVRRLRAQMDETIADSRSLILKISRPPKSAAELMQMRASLTGLPQSIEDISDRIKAHLKLYDDIEGFCHHLSPEEFRMRWELVAAPHLARVHLAQKASALQDYEAEFVRELLTQQDELSELLQEIEDTLKLFKTTPSYWDIASLSIIRDAVESLLERIEQAQQESDRIVEIEMMLERKPTDYAQIHQLSLSFNPFYQVWSIVYAFQEDRNMWELGEVEDHDALRRKLLQTCQVMDKTVKNLQMGNWPAPIVQLGEKQLMQMEEFQLMLLGHQQHHEEDG